MTVNVERVNCLRCWVHLRLDFLMQDTIITMTMIRNMTPPTNAPTIRPIFESECEKNNSENKYKNSLESSVEH